MAGDFTREQVLENLEELVTTDQWEALGVNPKRVMQMIGLMLPDNGIIDFRPLPEGTGKTIEGLHLIFVARKSIFYCHASRGTFTFRNVPIEQFRLTVVVTFAERETDQAEAAGQAENKRTTPKDWTINLRCDVGDFTVDGHPRIHLLEVPKRLGTRLLDLVGTINRLREER